MKIRIILTVTFTDSSFRGKLYNIGGDSPIKKNMADKIAGSRLEYDNLRNLYLRSFWQEMTFFCIDETAVVYFLISS